MNINNDLPRFPKIVVPARRWFPSSSHLPIQPRTGSVCCCMPTLQFSDVDYDTNIDGRWPNLIGVTRNTPIVGLREVPTLSARLAPYKDVQYVIVMMEEHQKSIARSWPPANAVPAFTRSLWRIPCLQPPPSRRHNGYHQLGDRVGSHSHLR